MKTNIMLPQESPMMASRLIGIGAIAVGLLLGLLTAWITPAWTFGILIGITFLAIGLKRPEIFILAYLVLTASIIQQTRAQSVSLSFGTVYFTDMLIFLLFGTILMRSLAESRFRLVSTPLDIPLLMFLVTSLVSTILAVTNGSVPFLQSLGEVRVVGSYLLFFAVTNLVRDKRQVMLLIEGLLGLAVLVAVTTIIQYVLGKTSVVLAGRIETFPAQDQVFRVIPLGQSVLVVAFLALVTLLLLDKPGLFNVARYIETGIIGLAILITFYRASWVSLAVCLIILAFIVGTRERQRFILWFVVALIAVGMVLVVLAGQPQSRGSSFVATVADRFNSIADPASYTDPTSSLRWRDFEYTYAMPRVLANFSDPFLGIGYGAYYRPLHPPQDWSGFDGRGYIHNGFLWIMMKSGILGFIGLIWFLVAIFVRGLKHWREILEPRWKAAVLAFSLVALVVLIVSNVAPYIMEAGWPPVIAVIAGISEVIIRKSREQTRPAQIEA